MRSAVSGVVVCGVVVSVASNGVKPVRMDECDWMLVMSSFTLCPSPG